MRWAWLAVAAATVCSCSTDGPLPASSSLAYEVVVTGEGDSTLCALLSTDTEGLPQREPLFDVSEHLGADYAASELRLARSIVDVDIDAYIYNKVEMKWRTNVYARPQIVVSLTAPSQRLLDEYIAKNGHKIVALLSRFERRVAMARLEKEDNPRARSLIREMFGVEMKVPARMLSSKKGKGFVWLSDNAASAMTNICVFWGSNIDSTLAANIKGEQPQMQMRIVRGTVGRSIGDSLTVSRGLWEMEGDAMGGPFVAHTVRTGNDSLTALAFVYAPGRSKRNLLRELESALFTLRIGVRNETVGGKRIVPQTVETNL